VAIIGKYNIGWVEWNETHRFRPRWGRSPADLAAGERQEKRIVRAWRRRHGLCLGPAGARSGPADPAFTDISLDVESRAAFGLLDAAAEAAAPYLQKMLADKAVIDLKPFAADAKKRLAAAVGDFAAQGAGLRANVSIDDLRLAGVAYDETLRIIANANGSVDVAVSSLALQ